MTDPISDDDKKLEYIDEGLLHPSIGRPPRQNDDDDSNMFMSEPSVSELGLESSSENRRRFSSPGQDSQDLDNGYRERANSGGGFSYPQQRLLHFGHPQTSPGNTSLSSWESPYINNGRRIQVQFSPDHPEVPNLQMPRPEYAQNANNTNLQHRNNLAPPNMHPVSDNNRSSNSTSSASTGQKESARQFLSDLRISSRGQVHESSNTGGTTDDSFESSWGDGPQRFAQVVRSPSASATTLPTDAAGHDSQQNLDDTVVMSLSASEDEELYFLDESSHNENSADDEQTADERPKRTKGTRPKELGHKRQRSGDEAAATMSTGSKDWKGMAQDMIPLPANSIDDDDEEPETSPRRNVPEDRRRMKTVNGPQSSGRPKSSTKETFTRPKKPRPTKYGANTSSGVPSSAQVDAYVRRPTRTEVKAMGPEQSIPSLNAYQSTPIPKDATGQSRSGHQSPHQELSSSPKIVLSPRSAFMQQVQSQWSESARRLQPSPPQHSFGSPSSGNFSGDFQTQLQNSYDDPSPRIGIPGPGPGHQSFSSIGSDFSWLTKQNQGAGTNQADTTQSHQHKANFETEESESSEADDTDTSFDVDVEARGAQDGHGTRTEGASRSERSRFSASRKSFAPRTGALHDEDDVHHYYVCPKCKTRQREFFTVSTAPRQFESASGYIAFYFGIYVVAALYIFGLQEGWPALDCIYFAVITLTTAGLGDLVPTSDGAKISCSIFIYFGVACIGLLLGSYIAGMLDESSSREAKANRIKSCPNCARIKSFREASERRQSLHSSMRMGAFEKSGPNKSFIPPNLATAMSHSQFEGPLQRTKAPNQSLGIVQENSPEIVDTPVTRSDSSGERSLGNYPSPQGLYGSPMGSFHTPPPNPYTMKNFTPQQEPSPGPGNMLKRQSHTRHASMDIDGSVLAASRSTAPPRKYSEDFPSTAKPNKYQNQSMSNAMGPPPPPPPTSAPKTQYEEYQTGFGTDDDSDSETSNSSESDNDELVAQYSEVKNAKYVFLTLKEALMNSMVIIAFGCLGFYFIEGFSIVDSWYFTTVLLTTVGYGDIVPVTKGGKLFATVYILVAGTILLNNMSLISMIPLELRKRRIEAAVLNQFGDSLDDDALRELATGPLVQRLQLSKHKGPVGLEECTREMFSLAMLVRLGKVTEDDIKQTFAVFQKLDVHDEGVLNSKTIIGGLIRKRSTLQLNKLGGGQVPSRFGTSTPTTPVFFGAPGTGTATPVYPTVIPSYSYATPLPNITNEMSEQSPLINGPPSYDSFQQQQQQQHQASPVGARPPNLFYSSASSVRSH